MRILLTNDDGFFAPGIRAMRHRLCQLGEVTIIAPMSEQSAAGHSITLYQPLVVREVVEDGVRLGYAVDGKPADCVKLGLVELLGYTPDLVVSGINAGSNAGINVLYSGTVAAAVEAAFFKITSIAVSLELAEAAQFERAALFAEKVIERILETKPQPGALFNVNIPDLAPGDPLGIRVAQQGLSFYREHYEKRTDPRGRDYYWLLPDALTAGKSTECDLAAMASRYIAVTPLQFDLTDHERVDRLSGLNTTWGDSTSLSTKP